MKRTRVCALIVLVISLVAFSSAGCGSMEAQKKYQAGLEQYQKKKDYNEAIRELTEAIKLDPGNSAAYSLLGWSYVKKGRIDLACPQFAKAVANDSANMTALGGQALCFYTSGKDKEAIAAARKVYELARAMILHPDFDYFSLETRNLYNDFAADSKEIIGKCSQRQGKFADAIPHLEEALKKPASWSNPQELRIHLAQSLYGAKKYDRALEEYSQILSQNSKSPEALVGRGWVYLRQKKEREAEKDFRAALKLNPAPSLAAAGLAEIGRHRLAQSQEAWELLNKKEYEKAAAAFRRHLGQHPEWAILHDGLGWSLYGQGRMAEAEASFEKALKLDKGLTASLTGKEWVAQWRFAPLNAAWAQFNNLQYDRALAAFEEVLKDPSARLPRKEAWRAHAGLGWAFYWKKDYGKAGNSFREALQQSPGNAGILKGLGYTHWGLAEYDAALRELGRSLAANSAQADVKAMAGWCHYRKKDYAKAVEAFQQALKIYPSWTDAFAGLGFAWNALGEKEKALASFRSALWLLPGHMATGEFRGLLDQEQAYWPLFADWGWAYFYAWKFSEAEEQFARGLKKVPDDPALLRALGYAQYRLTKYDQAAPNLEKSWQLDSKLKPVDEYVTILNTPGAFLVQSDAQLRLAWCLYFKKDYGKAQVLFEEVMARQPKWANPRAGLGWCLFMAEKYEQAEKAFHEAAKIDPNYPDSYNGLNAVARVRYAPANKAWSHYYLGDYDAAIREFQAAMQAKPQLLPVKEVERLPLGIGWSLYWKKDYPGAAAEFKKVLAKAPQDFSARQGLGYIYFQEKNFEAASSELEGSLKSFPGNVDAQINLGWASYRKGDYEKAARAFTQAVALNPYLADPYKGLAWSRWQGGQKSAAKENFAKAIALHPQSVEDEEFGKAFKGKEGTDLCLKLGWSYYQKGLSKEARKNFEHVLSLVPESAEALSGLGYLSYARKEYPQAISHFEKVLAREPSWDAVRMHLAWSYYFEKEYARAKQEFARLVSSSAKVAAYQSGLGWALYHLKDGEGARRAFESALQMNPYDPSALEGVALLKKK